MKKSSICNIKTRTIGLTGFIVFFLALPTKAQESFALEAKPIGKVIGSEINGNSTQLVLEVNRRLVPGQIVRLPDNLPVVVGEMLSEKMSLFYFGANMIGKYKNLGGTDVFLEGAPLQTFQPQEKRLTFRKKIFQNWSPYAAKKTAEVSSVQGDRALINRGSIHEVRERDIYAIYNSSGSYKGMIEVRGPGDFQSQGKLYNTFEDFGKRRRALQTEPGDRAILIGQRKLFNLHFLIGAQAPRQESPGEHKHSVGGGLLWTVTLPDGWGVEFLFGGYLMTRDMDFQKNITFGGYSYTYVGGFPREARWLAPVWLRKNFFYPHSISPYVGIGVAYLQAKAELRGDSSTAPRPYEVAESKIVGTLGGGLELFPGKFLHPRIEIKHFMGPTLTAAGQSFPTASTFYSFGLSTSW